MKQTSADIRSFLGPPVKHPKFYKDNESRGLQADAPATDVPAATMSDFPATASAAASTASDSVLDIASFVSCGATATDCCKMKLIESRKPALTISMPSHQYPDKSRTGGVRQRFCKHDWFDKFPFTSFSPSVCGIFCLSCILFPVEQQTSGRAQILIIRPLINWKDAVADLTAHSHLKQGWMHLCTSWHILRSGLICHCPQLQRNG